MRAKYCKCKNTYTINNCDCDKQPYYWEHGIGSLTNQQISDTINLPRAFSNGFSKAFS